MGEGTGEGWGITIAPPPTAQPLSAWPQRQSTTHQQRKANAVLRARTLCTSAASEACAVLRKNAAQRYRQKTDPFSSAPESMLP